MTFAGGSATVLRLGHYSHQELLEVVRSLRYTGRPTELGDGLSAAAAAMSKVEGVVPKILVVTDGVEEHKRRGIFAEPEVNAGNV